MYSFVFELPVKLSRLPARQSSHLLILPPPHMAITSVFLSSYFQHFASVLPCTGHHASKCCHYCCVLSYSITLCACAFLFLACCPCVVWRPRQLRILPPLLCTIKYVKIHLFSFVLELLVYLSRLPARQSSHLRILQRPLCSAYGNYYCVPTLHHFQHVTSVIVV